jgi:proteic killer suppression protein
VSGKSRAVPGVCHSRSESNGEPLTWTNVLATSRWVWRRLIALAPISGSHAWRRQAATAVDPPPVDSGVMSRCALMSDEAEVCRRAVGRECGRSPRLLVTCCVNNVWRYHRRVLRSFRDKETQAVWHRQRSRRLDGPVQRVAWRKLAMLDAAETLTDLLVPPCNRLEKLTGGRAGQYSIRINQQWRICFFWSDAGPEDVEIVDYH